jgi:potassium-dependent mechanosensitive channel
MNRKHLHKALLCLFLLASPSLLWAAVNPLSKVIGTSADTAVTPTASTEMTDAEIDANRLKLDAKAAELRRQTGPEAAAALRGTWLDTATPQEMDDWIKLSNRLIGIQEDHSTALFRFRNYRKATRDKVEEMKDWKGFAEKPPYSILLVDNLRDTLNAKQNVLKSLDVIRTTIEGEFEEFSSSLRNSSKLVRLAEENLEKNSGKPDEQRSRWLLQLAQLQHEVNQAGVVYGETRRLSTTELLKGVQTEVDFLKHKLAVALDNYRFSEEDLKQKLQAIDDQLIKVRQRLAQDKNLEKTTRNQLDAAEVAVSKAQALLAAGGRPKIPLEQLLQEQKRRQIRFDDATIRVLVTSGMQTLLKGEKAIWAERYDIAGGRDSRDTRAELKSPRNELDLIAKWKDYIATKLSIATLLIKNQQTALASDALTPGERKISAQPLSSIRVRRSCCSAAFCSSTITSNSSSAAMMRRNAYR